MQENLGLSTYFYLKIILGGILLLVCAFFPYFGYISFVAVLGRAHTIGAWLSMWRAGKLNWTYVMSLAVITIVVSFWGLRIVSKEILVFVAYSLFIFHFFFDEFDLMEYKKTWSSIISSFVPTFLIFIYFTSDIFRLSIPMNLILVLAILSTVVELLLSRHVDWFFVHMKMIFVFILFMILTGIDSITIINIFLIYHYVFWFVYPVYKLNKSRPRDVPGFVMMLIIIVLLSVFVYSASVWGGVLDGVQYTYNQWGGLISNEALRLFMVATIVHIISTAPFGYLFGLPKRS